MKKIFVFTMMLAMALTMQAAKVGFLLPNVSKTAASVDVYNEALPWDAYWDGVNHEQSPERKAYEWFNGTYSATKSFYTIYDVEQGVLLSDGKPVVDVLWYNLDRTGNIGNIVDNYLNRDGFKTALANYVKAGGNLLLTKQAVRMVFEMGRISGEGSFPTFNVGAYTTSTSVTDYGLREMNGSSGFKVFDGCEFYTYVYPMSTTSYTANRQCVWDLKDGETIIVETFEGNHKCKALGMDQNDVENATGFVEFYPNDPFKGTILAMGLNAYEWGAGNSLNDENFDRVKKLTQNMLDYLSVKPSDASVNWQGWETAANGYIGGSLAAATAPTQGDHISTISAASYTSSNANVASVNDSTGAVQYNYFGSATISSTVTVTGDGQWIPKNAVAVSKNKSVTVTGGSSSAAIGYVLTVEQGLNRLSEEYTGIQNPDLTAAKWFYDNYVAGGTGQFVNPGADFPAAVKTLWIHSDRKDLASGDYLTELGGGTFLDKLRTWLDQLNATNSVFVSKQATRLIGDLGRCEYPTYGAGDDSWDYSSWGPFTIGNNFVSPISVDHSTHAVYGLLGTNPTLMTSGTHTNRNYVLKLNDSSWDGLTSYDAFNTYQTTYDCRLLGDWGNNTSKYECGGLVEFYPKGNLTCNGKSYYQRGTVIMLGLAAYQWISPTDNMKALTSQILSYLNISEMPMPDFNWIQAPYSHYPGSTQVVQIPYFMSLLSWTTSDADVVEIDTDPAHSTDTDYKLLRLKAEGEATITATRSADGYGIPRHVAGSRTATKTIKVSYTVDGCDNCFYYIP